MRRRLVLLVTVLPVALTGPLAGTAHAATCAAVAVPPHFVPWRGTIEASGTFRCDQPAPGMTLTVCVEELLGDLTSQQEWFVRGCETAVAEGETEALSSRVAVDVMVYSTYLRTTVSAANANGDVAETKSPPVFWFNCACYIG